MSDEVVKADTSSSVSGVTRAKGIKHSSRSLLKSPWLEISLMAAVLALSYVAIGLIARGVETPADGMSASTILGLLVGFFLLSFAVALVAVLAGIGGGLIFTPIMLAFTSVDTVIVRATGLIVAMFSGLISTGPFMRRGLANLKICLLCLSVLSVGAFVGAQGAIILAESMGETGDGIVRLSLGIIIFVLVAYFIRGGAHTEWPEIKRVDRFTKWLNLSQPYYEESLNKVIDYKVTRAGWILLVMLGVGLVSGFFGLGGGWAAVPALNLIMGVPLKVAAACSGVLLGVGSCTGVWPYLLSGAIIPIFAAPWLIGQVLGGLVGSLLLIRIKATFVRFILIGLLFFSGFSLVTKGLSNFGVIGELPIAVFLTILALDAAIVFLAITGRLPRLRIRR
ncbi:sulfite exporter TauE/SafE family protein [Chloroflexota bacterium]